MRLRDFLFVGALVLVAACGEKDRPAPYRVPIPNPNVPHERLPAQTEAFRETRCPVRVPGHVIQCGYVTVPQGAGTEKEIEIYVARVFSDAEVVQPEPVIYLDGGPGAASVRSADAYFGIFSQGAPDRDIIFIDQRGVGDSKPALDCHDTGEDAFEAMQKCFLRLSKDWDLDAFNTINNARDVDSVRRAFGYEKVNLWGISYGTRLGLTVMRDHPAGVRAAVLDGVVPLEADLLGEVGLNGYQAFEEVVRTCAADPDCSLAYPDPLGQLIGVVKKLNDEPQELSSGALLSGDIVLQVIFQSLYSPQAVAYIPLMISQIAGEDYSLFEQVGEAVASGGISYGMHVSLQCSEEVPFSSPTAYAAFDAQIPSALRGGLSGAYYFEICEAWPVTPAAPSENDPVVSDLPALVTAGQFDPITPPKYSAQVHESLTNSRYYLIMGESHGASAASCGLKMVARFLDDPSADPSDSCLTDVPDLEFQSLSNDETSHTRVGRELVLRTVPPSDAERREMLDDLRRRVRHH